MIAQAIHQGIDCTVVLRNYKKDGTLFWNELTLSPVKDPGTGTLTHIIGIQNDVTARKNTEALLARERLTLEERVRERTNELKASEVFLAGIIETIRESLIVLDESIQVLTVNRHFCQFFKVSEDEVLGKHLYELGNGQWDNAQLRELLEKILPTHNPFEGFRVEHHFPHIGKKIILLNARQITHEGNYLNRILLALEDVTDFVESDRRKDDFISIASHELRTPLTTVKGYIQLLQLQAFQQCSPRINYGQQYHHSRQKRGLQSNDIWARLKVSSCRIFCIIPNFLLIMSDLGGVYLLCKLFNKSNGRMVYFFSCYSIKEECQLDHLPVDTVSEQNFIYKTKFPFCSRSYCVILSFKN